MLLACPKSSDSLPEIFDEDPENADIDLIGFTDGSAGCRVRHTREGVEKPGQLVRLLLDPSHAQLFCEIKCDDHAVIQTRRELVNFEGD